MLYPPGARPREIGQRRLAPGLAGLDVCTVQGRVGAMGWAAAVCATPSRPRTYLAAQGGGDALTGHRRRVASPVLP